MSVALNSGAFNGGYMKLTLTGAASAAAGGLGELANPEGVMLGITRAWIYARTGSTGAANLTVGLGATGNSDSSVCSAMDVIEATVGGDMTFLPAAQVAETDNPALIWQADEFLTFAGSATTVGLDADIYVEYIRLD